ncbi:TetR/AcrR family transcriptional regulator [Nocardia sp. 2]|uniref:TetR/AcrR family transcriptional regulator n=1 Tax=Nocardia acididurans TaxID=2802282 RepID=A0ABS1MJN1_9NOCA|nr:TetR/AcrR family transcriptional regulator [Nocardia acididurans]MBL1079884.1 TetR/AcrR family transcriptional regulator [Nocardia acididurans]
MSDPAAARGSRAAADQPRRRYAPRLPPEERRAQLLDAAFAVLAKAELHELSMEAVAQEAGVGKPVLYTVFKTRADLVEALLERERERGLEQVADTLPADLLGADPVTAASATVEAFVAVALENPTRWRLILASPTAAPEEYRAALRSSRTGIFDQAEALVRMGAALDPRWAAMDSGLVTNSLLTVAEMLGRLAVSEPAEYPKERLEAFVRSIVALLGAIP